MFFSLHIQDPHDPNTTYLYEALIQELMTPTIGKWEGIYSFVTGAGVRSLFGDDPVVTAFLEQGQTNLVVGIDAVTDISALQELSELNARYPNFNAHVYTNPGGRLFHPKLSRFFHSDGTAALVTGSGNLTPGGLRTNTEAFSVARGSLAELSTLTTWDEWLIRHAADIGPITEAAYEQARRNAIRRRAAPPAEPREEEVEVVPEEVAPPADSAVLIAVVPKAGDRWHQVHYNADVIEQFFRITPNSAQRAFLQQVYQDGSVGPEERRPLVFSESNRNLKIEVAAHRGEDYPPQETPPIIVLHAVGTRMFRYMLLMPDEPGYSLMAQFLVGEPSIGKGVPRVITDYDNLKRMWPRSPL